MASPWIEARDEQLKKLYAEGLSMTQIAIEMDCGLTRNSVIGRAHRLKLPSRRDNVVRHAKQAKPALEKRTRLVRSNSNSTALRLIHVNEPTTPGALRCVEVESRRLTLLELEPNDCRYPDGEGSDITFCGNVKLAGSSYCPSHFVLTRRQDQKPREGQPARMPTNMADGRQTRAVVFG